MVAKARFIEPMLLLRTESLPEGPDWLYEIKLDGYRAPAIKSGGKCPCQRREESQLTVISDPRTISLNASCTSTGGNPSHLRRHSKLMTDFSHVVQPGDKAVGPIGW
jgi:hypothetical protein